MFAGERKPGQTKISREDDSIKSPWQSGSMRFEIQVTIKSFCAEI